MVATFLSLTSVKCRCRLNVFFMATTSSTSAIDFTLICLRFSNRKGLLSNTMLATRYWFGRRKMYTKKKNRLHDAVLRQKVLGSYYFFWDDKIVISVERMVLNCDRFTLYGLYFIAVIIIAEVKSAVDVASIPRDKVSPDKNK